MCITKYGVEIDIWAAGCILAELLILSPIFKGKTEGDQLFAIFEILGSFTEKEKEELKKRVPFDESLFEKFPQYPKGGLKDIFEDVKDRENAIDLIEKMLTYIPEDRITAE